MIISKKGAVAALKEAWKKGYEIVPRGTRISVYTENWALELQTKDLPLEVSQVLVEHYEGIPVEPAFVQKNRDKQTMLDMETEERGQELIYQQEQPKYMHRIPVLYRDRWAMFGTSMGEWICVDQRFVEILEDIHSVSVMMTQNGMALFSLQDERLTVAPGKFGTEDWAKLQKIAELYVEQKVAPEEMPENLCLFEDMERDE